METEEKVFKDIVKTVFTATQEATAKVMSTVDGKWLERGLDVQYCWDFANRCCSVPPSTRSSRNSGSRTFRFWRSLPTLCSSLHRRDWWKTHLPDPSSQPQGPCLEYRRTLEGIGNLLMTGYTYVDANKLAGRSDGIVDFVKVPTPPYPYSKSSYLVEDGATKTLRLRAPPRPLAKYHFRINVDTHPDLAGHVIMGRYCTRCWVRLSPSFYEDSPSNAPYSYAGAVLENGAFVVENVKVLRPFVLNRQHTAPGHAGVIINGSCAVPPTAGMQMANQSSRAVPSSARTRGTALHSMSNPLRPLRLST